MYENSQSKPQAKITNLFLDFDEVTNLGSEGSERLGPSVRLLY